ncbi:LLM class flavin-dependent oxidoreductase [Actinoplanes sp. GCM10030250]|uniref:LLM class flavin-dependent oxidoreductase n=1 Tax=Actinoplanes sp. GCM10030250 TaxID=3273376 RepID=UPI003621983F
MRFGAHLPLIDFDGRGWRPGELGSYVDVARQLRYDAVGVNDHLVFQRPWLDGIVALASVIERSGDMRLATTVALPVVRGAAALAKAAAALDILSGGRLVLGVGPGSSARDYALAGLDFDERWPRLDDAIRAIRAHLGGASAYEKDGGASAYEKGLVLQPAPVRLAGPPIWIGSWGSEAGMRRVARLGDGWLASAYNASPAQVAEARARLGVALERAGKRLDGFECALATMWIYVTDSGSERDERLSALGRMLNRPAEQLRERVLVGPAAECAATLRAYAEAGIDQVFVWPLADPHDQLERLMRDVVPLAVRP